MGWVKDTIKCLGACSIRLKFKCKSGCCASDCMLEETPNELSKQESSTSVEESSKSVGEQMSTV
jgi:hypothetical protein